MEAMEYPSTASSRSRKPRSVDLETAAPFLPWDELYSYLRQNFEQGDHVAIIGPTGTGKTHLAFDLAEIREYVMVVATKPRDPLVEDARKRGYYLIPGNKLEVPYSDGKPIHRRVIYWPRLPSSDANKLRSHQLLAAEKKMQKPKVGGAIGYVRRYGHWAILIDEGTWVCRDLKLQTDVDSALFSFRSNRSSIIILGQRPAWMGRYVMSMPTHLFLFKTSNRDDRKALGDISGVDHKLVEAILRNLDRDSYEFLYIDARTDTLYRSIAPAR